MARSRWAGATVVCIASGPSLIDEQLEQIRKAREAGHCRVIAINDNWCRAHWADLLYACDERWWDYHIAAIRESDFAGELWTMSSVAASRYGLVPVTMRRRPGLSNTPGVISHGGNSGYQALGLAYQLGARRVVLVGYDMQHTGGKTHWFGDHPPGFSNAPGVARWCKNFAKLAAELRNAGVDVINATRETALDCFPRQPLHEIFYRGRYDADPPD